MCPWVRVIDSAGQWHDQILFVLVLKIFLWFMGQFLLSWQGRISNFANEMHALSSKIIWL